MCEPHKHSSIIKAWADGETIEFYSRADEAWHETKHPTFQLDTEYRIQPKVILINGTEVPYPERKRLNLGEDYFVPDPSTPYGVNKWRWKNDMIDLRLLQRGMIHKSYDAAFTHADALYSFTKV